MSQIKPVRLADTIAQHLQQLILEGTLQPGERLIAERELSAKLNVSRPSLREGLDKLIATGLLTTNAQGVTYVSDKIGASLRDPLLLLLDDPDARSDLIELRSAIEFAAAGLAADRASDVDRQILEARFAAMIMAHEAEDIDEIALADAEFHFAIYEASHNRMLLHLMRSLEDLIRTSVYNNRKNLFRHRSEPSGQIAEHRAIFEAIMARNAASASEAARNHMTSTLRAQNAIREAEQRLETSIRRLSRGDLIADGKRRKTASPNRN